MGGKGGPTGGMTGGKGGPPQQHHGEKTRSAPCGCEVNATSSTVGQFCTLEMDPENGMKVGLCRSCRDFADRSACKKAPGFMQSGSGMNAAQADCPLRGQADCRTRCFGAPSAVPQPPTCDSVKNVASFCKDNGANGLVAKAHSVQCADTWTMKQECTKKVDAHVCCRAPSNCKLDNGMGKVSFKSLQSLYTFRGDPDREGSFMHIYKHARVHLSNFKLKVWNTTPSLLNGKDNDGKGRSLLGLWDDHMMEGVFDDRGICGAAIQRLDQGLSACGLTHGGVTLLCSGTYPDRQSPASCPECFGLTGPPKDCHGDPGCLATQHGNDKWVNRTFNDSSAATVLAVCVTPCMANLNTRCCTVPKPACKFG